MMEAADEKQMVDGTASARNVISLPAAKAAKHLDIATSSMNALSKHVAALVARLGDVDLVITALPDSAIRASLKTSCDEQRRALVAASGQLHEQISRLARIDRRATAAFSPLQKK